MNLLLLAVLSASVPAAQAADDPFATVQEGAAALGARGEQAAAERQKTAGTQSGKPVLDALAYLKTAGLKNEDLIERGYRPQNIVDLAEAVRAASGGLAAWYQAHPSAVAETYRGSFMKYVNGTLTNMEDSARLLPTFGKASMDRGCLAHQRVTSAALQGLAGKSLAVRPIVIGAGMEHHAVVVFPKDLPWQKAGIVLDGWRFQSAAPRDMTFILDAWELAFVALRFRGTRLEE